MQFEFLSGALKAAPQHLQLFKGREMTSQTPLLFTLLPSGFHLAGFSLANRSTFHWPTGTLPLKTIFSSQNSQANQTNPHQKETKQNNTEQSKENQQKNSNLFGMVSSRDPKSKVGGAVTSKDRGSKVHKIESQIVPQVILCDLFIP